MTLAETLQPKLSEWRPAGDGRHSWAAATVPGACVGDSSWELVGGPGEAASSAPSSPARVRSAADAEPWAGVGSGGPSDR